MRMKLLIAVLAVVAILTAGIAVLFSTAGGQRFLTDRIARAIGGADQTVTVKEIGGDWPSHIIWTGVVVADSQGPWLTLDRIELRLVPGALFTGRVEVSSAAVGTAHMLRQPVSQPQRTPSPPPTVDSITRTLSRITVRDARVGILLLDPPVIGRAVDATLTASLQDDPDSRLHTLALDVRLRQEPGAVALKLAAGRAAAVLQVNASAESLTAAGAITLNNRTTALSGALKLACQSTTVCYAGPDVRIGAVTADLALAGTLAAPEGRLDVQARDLAYAGRRLSILEGQLVALPQADAARATVSLTGAGTAAGVPDALPEVRSVLSEQGRWSFALTRAPDGALTLESAVVESGGMVAQVAALGLTPKLTPTTLRVTLTGGGRLLGLDDASSRTEAALRIDRLEEGAGAGHLSLSTKGLPPSAQIHPLLQDSLSLEADVNLAAAQATFADIVAQSGAAVVRGASTWTRAAGFDHQASAFAVALPAWGTVVPEPVQAEAKLAGPLATLHADVTAKAPNLVLSRAPVREAALTLAFDRTAEGFKATLDGTGQWVDGTLALTAVLAQAKPGRIDVTGLTWKSPTTDLTGELALDTEAGLITGTLRGPISDLAPLTTAFGVASAGAADIDATFAADKGQRLDVTLAAKKVRNAVLEAGTLTFTGRFDDLFGDMRLSTRAEATDASLFGRPLAGFVTRADGTLKTLSVSLDAKGAADIPFSIASATDIAFGERMEVAFQRLAVQDGGLQAALRAPTRLTIGADAMTLAPTRVAVQGGEVQVSFNWDKRTDLFDGAIKAQNVALPAFAAIPGQPTSIVLNGDVALSGPVTSTDVAARLTGTLPGADGQPPIDITAAIALANGRAKIEAAAAGLSSEPARLVADVPARLNLAAARFSLITTQPASGSLEWRGTLAPLWRLVPADVNVLAGDVVIDVSLAGTLDTPVLSGAFNLSRGTYENLVGGTALRNIEASVGGDGQGGFTLALKAQDMNDGTVALSGRVAGDANMTADITADLARLDILHRDDVVAAATGKITYSGPFAAGVFKGEVQMVNSLVRLGGSYMPEIPLLRALPGFEPVGSGSLLSAIGADIAVTTSNPMRIEGQGLDSLWRGQLNVAGTIAQPDVRGALTLDRGSFSFLGQTFTLDSGTVTFTGGGTIDPQLNIVAVREASDITATVNITGRARAPDVQLSSRPALPRDEILARLLFRKGTGELGPIESIQLASAASDLAGLSQGGINGVLRRTFGVDVSSGAEGNAVMVGRQVGRNLYVSVGQSLTEQEREIVVEWRLSRSFSVKSTTSDVTGADIGFFWRKDY